MKDLHAIKGAYYIRGLIAEGEHERQDFKFAISDARKIARSISAFANNDGGRLLIGVKDNGVIAGVRNEEDIYVVEEAAQLYCRPEQELNVTAFRADGGATVVRVEIARSLRRPVEVKEANGEWKAYYRVADENIAVPYFMAEAWRSAANSQGLVVNLSGPERDLLKALADDRAMSPRDVARVARVTHSGAMELIARLYTLNLIEFSYRPGGFFVTSRTE